MNSELLFLVFFIVTTLLVGVQNPFMFCLLFIAFSLFRIHEALPILYDLKIPLVLGIASSVGVVWHVVFSRSITPLWTPQLKLFALFVVLVIIGSPFAEVREVSFDFLQDSGWKIALMTFAISWFAPSEDDFRAAARLFVFCGCLVSSVAIYNSTMGIDLVEGSRVTIGRTLHSSIGDPNDLALVLLFPFGFAMSFLLHRTGALNTMLGLIAVPTIMVAIGETQSRGGMIGVIAVLAMLGARYVRSKVLLIILVAAAAVGLFAFMGISQREAVANADMGVDESAMSRLYLWTAAIKMALAHPLVGVGVNNFSSAVWRFGGHVSGHADLVAHSTWFTALAETGFPGFAVFTGMVIASFLSVRRSLEAMATTETPEIVQAMGLAIAIGLVGFCSSGSFLTQTFSWQIYILVSLSTALEGYTRLNGKAAPATAPHPEVRHSGPADTEAPDG